MQKDRKLFTAAELAELHYLLCEYDIKMKQAALINMDWADNISSAVLVNTPLNECMEYD